MTNNDIVKRLRYALHLDDATIINMMELSGYQMTQDELALLLKNEDEIGYVNCSDKVLTLLLDGLIVQRRGRNENSPEAARPVDANLDNNLIMKKLRIAMNFKEEDMLATLALAGLEISKAELGALFRKPGHRNYQECGDQILRNFLNGLELKFKEE